VRALIPVLALAVIALATIAVVAIRSRVERARQARRELARHEAFLNDLHKQAIGYRDTHVIADLFADQIRTHLTEKEIPR
jgi:hypothetical protein